MFFHFNLIAAFLQNSLQYRRPSESRVLIDCAAFVGDLRKLLSTQRQRRRSDENPVIGYQYRPETRWTAAAETGLFGNHSPVRYTRHVLRRHAFKGVTSVVCPCLSSVLRVTSASTSNSSETFQWVSSNGSNCNTVIVFYYYLVLLLFSKTHYATVTKPNGLKNLFPI